MPILPRKQAPCAGCPLAGAPCIGEAVPRFCTLRRTRPAYERIIVRDSAGIELSGEPGPGPTVALAASSPPPVVAGHPLLTLAGARVRQASVVYLLNGAGICGGVRVVIEHLNGLTDRGHHIVLATMDGSVPPAGWLDVRFPIVSFRDAQASGLWRTAGALVATHWTTAAAVAAGHEDGRPRFYLVQGYEDRFGSEAENTRARATYRLPGLRPLTIAGHLRDWLERDHGHRDTPVVVNGVAGGAFWPETGHLRPIDAARPVVLIEGTDGHSAKDLATAHAAAALLRTRGLDLEVWGVSQDAGVAERFAYDRFWHRPDATTLRRIYADADLLLKTSVFEGRPCPPIEAAACGTPTVMTDFPGAAEDLDGIVPRAPIGDAAAVASIAAGLLRDPAAMRAAQVEGLRRAAGLTWDRAIDRLEAIYGLPTGDQIKRGTLGVLLPTRDRPHLIGRALASLQAQTRADWRCLIVVNGNRDPAGYMAALAPYLSDSRIAVHTIDAEGIPQALNAGLVALPPTDYLAVLEDDDEWHPDFLAATTAVLDRQPAVTMAYVDTEERGPAIPRIHCPAHGEYDNAVHRGGNWIAFPAMAWRRALIAANDGFDETTGGACDWDTGLRLAALGEVRRVRRALLIHWWHERNTCANADYMRPFVDRILAKVKAGAYDRAGSTPVVASPPSTPTAEPALPGAIRTGANFAKALIGRATDGRPMLDDATAHARLAICKACVGPDGFYRESDGRCAHKDCGCYLEIGPTGGPGKVFWPEQFCPIGKWGAVPIEGPASIGGGAEAPRKGG